MDPTDASLNLAKAVFGRAVRGHLGAWIVRRNEQRFFLQEAQDAMSSIGAAASATKQEVDRLVAAGLLKREPDGRRVYFSRRDSAAWAVFEAAASALDLG